MNMEMICILCPMGCILDVQKEGDVVRMSGNGCPRGAQYGKQELIKPMRVVTTNVRIEGSGLPLCPAKTKGMVDKAKIDDVLKAAYKVRISAPVKVGDILIRNVADTDVDLVATANRI